MIIPGITIEKNALCAMEALKFEVSELWRIYKDAKGFQFNIERIQELVAKAPSLLNHRALSFDFLPSFLRLLVLRMRFSEISGYQAVNDLIPELCICMKAFSDHGSNKATPIIIDDLFECLNHFLAFLVEIPIALIDSEGVCLSVTTASLIEMVVLDLCGALAIVCKNYPNRKKIYDYFCPAEDKTASFLGRYVFDFSGDFSGSKLIAGSLLPSITCAMDFTSREISSALGALVSVALFNSPKDVDELSSLRWSGLKTTATKKQPDEKKRKRSRCDDTDSLQQMKSLKLSFYTYFYTSLYQTCGNLMKYSNPDYHVGFVGRGFATVFETFATSLSGFAQAGNFDSSLGGSESLSKFHFRLLTIFFNFFAVIDSSINGLGDNSMAVAFALNMKNLLLVSLAGFLPPNLPNDKKMLQFFPDFRLFALQTVERGIGKGGASTVDIAIASLECMDSLLGIDHRLLLSIGDDIHEIGEAIQVEKKRRTKTVDDLSASVAGKEPYLESESGVSKSNFDANFMNVSDECLFMSLTAVLKTLVAVIGLSVSNNANDARVRLITKNMLLHVVRVFVGLRKLDMVISSLIVTSIDSLRVVNKYIVQFILEGEPFEQEMRSALLSLSASQVALVLTALSPEGLKMVGATHGCILASLFRVFTSAALARSTLLNLTAFSGTISFFLETSVSVLEDARDGIDLNSAITCTMCIFHLLAGGGVTMFVGVGADSDGDGDHFDVALSLSQRWFALETEFWVAMDCALSILGYFSFLQSLAVDYRGIKNLELTDVFINGSMAAVISTIFSHSFEAVPTTLDQSAIANNSIRALLCLLRSSNLWFNLDSLTVVEFSRLFILSIRYTTGNEALFSELCALCVSSPFLDNDILCKAVGYCIAHLLKEAGDMLVNEYGSRDNIDIYVGRLLLEFPFEIILRRITDDTDTNKSIAAAALSYLEKIMDQLENDCELSIIEKLTKLASVILVNKPALINDQNMDASFLKIMTFLFRFPVERLENTLGLLSWVVNSSVKSVGDRSFAIIECLLCNVNDCVMSHELNKAVTACRLLNVLASSVESLRKCDFECSEAILKLIYAHCCRLRLQLLANFDDNESIGESHSVFSYYVMLSSLLRVINVCERNATVDESSLVSRLSLSVSDLLPILSFPLRTDPDMDINRIACWLYYAGTHLRLSIDQLDDSSIQTLLDGLRNLVAPVFSAYHDSELVMPFLSMRLLIPLPSHHSVFEFFVRGLLLATPPTHFVSILRFVKSGCVLDDLGISFCRALMKESHHFASSHQCDIFRSVSLLLDNTMSSQLVSALSLKRADEGKSGDDIMARIVSILRVGVVIVSETSHVRNGLAYVEVASLWISSCANILSKLVDILQGSRHSNLSLEVFDLMGSLFTSPKASSLGSSSGVVATLLSRSLTLVLDSECSTAGSALSSRMSVDVRRLAMAFVRTLAAAANATGLEKHAHVIAARLITIIGKRLQPASNSLIEIVSPGIFSLFEKCRLRQRKQIFAALDAQSRIIFEQLLLGYNRDFKFVGKA